MGKTWLKVPHSIRVLVSGGYPASQGQGNDFNPVSPDADAVIKKLEELSRD